MSLNDNDILKGMTKEPHEKGTLVSFPDHEGKPIQFIVQNMKGAAIIPVLANIRKAYDERKENAEATKTSTAPPPTRNPAKGDTNAGDGGGRKARDEKDNKSTQTNAQGQDLRTYLQGRKAFCELELTRLGKLRLELDSVTAALEVLDGGRKDVDNRRDRDEAGDGRSVAKKPNTRSRKKAAKSGRTHKGAGE